jgi:hypothetical protein
MVMESSRGTARAKRQMKPLFQSVHPTSFVDMLRYMQDWMWWNLLHYITIQFSSSFIIPKPSFWSPCAWVNCFMLLLPCSVLQRSDNCVVVIGGNKMTPFKGFSIGMWRMFYSKFPTKDYECWWLWCGGIIIFVFWMSLILGCVEFYIWLAGYF